MRISDWSSDVCSSDLHVVEHVAVERPVTDRVGGDVEGDLAARQHVHRVLARCIFAMAGHQLEKMAVQVDRMRHHRVVDERHPHPLVLQERDRRLDRSEEHTSELQSLMRISYAVFCLKTNKQYY